MEAEEEPPDLALRDGAHILDAAPVAGLAGHHWVEEGQLGDGEPGAVREEVEPGGGAGQHAQLDLAETLPENPRDQRVLYQTD